MVRSISPRSGSHHSTVQFSDPMELRHAPVALRRAFDAWVLVFGVALGLLVLL